MSKHRLIALWSHPRSRSSAFARVMVERGDLRTFHEPFLYWYYLGLGRRTLPHFAPKSGHPTTYDTIRAMLLGAASCGPVFFKDMSYYVIDRIAGDGEFLDRITSTFLVRDPAYSIPSYHRLDPTVTCAEIGLEAQWRHFERVAERSRVTPVVIDADDLEAEPDATVRAYCEAVGIEHLPAALEWSPGLPEAWGEVAGWHGSMAASTGLRRRTGPPPAPPPMPESMQRWLEHHRPFYQRLRAHRLRPGSSCS